MTLRSRLSALALALVGVLAPSTAFAAPAEAAASADTSFSDPAMSFVAPSDFQKVPVPPHDPAKFEQKSVVAAFMKNPGKQNAVSITITMDNFEIPSAAAFATNADNDLRGSTDGVFIKRTDTKLANGMPAVFEEVTIGTGFDQMTMYRMLWADGVRGVIVEEVARLGSIDTRKARADMANLSATAYPRYRY